MEYVILSLFIVMYILSLLSFKFALFFYILFIPLRPIIDMRLLGSIQVADLFWLIMLLYFFSLGIYHKAFQMIKSVKPLQSLVIFTVLIFIISYANYVRETYMLNNFFSLQGIDADIQFSFKWVAIRVLQMSVYIMNFIALLTVIFSDKKYRQLIVNAIVLSAAIVIISMYFAPFLESIGLNIKDSVEYRDAFQGRSAGLFRAGDMNSVATFLNLVIIVYITNLVILKKPLSFTHFIVLLFLTAGIFLAGSRMGFVMLVLSFSYFVFVLNVYLSDLSVRTFISTLLIIMVIASLAVLLVQHDRFGVVFERMQAQGLTGEISSQGQRYIRWMGYINFTFSDISRTLWGSNEVYFAFEYGDFRDPHNSFIKTLYGNGIFMLLLLFWGYYQLFLSFIKMKLLPFFIPLSAVVFISSMIISSMAFREYYILGLGIIIHGLLLDNRTSTGLTEMGVLDAGGLNPQQHKYES